MNKQKPKEKNFMDYVQSHEREWGNASYAGRPDLIDIIKAPVVVFWVSIEQEEKKPPTITLYESLDDLENQISKLVFRAMTNDENKKPAIIFENQSRVIIKGVKLLFETVTQ